MLSSRIMIKNHLATLSNFLDLHSSKYEKMLIFGDFNVRIGEPHLKSFCKTYNFTNLIKQPTCYKYPDTLRALIWSLLTVLRKVSVFGVFLVRIFPHSDRIQKDTEHLSIFSPNPGKYGPKKLGIQTLFTQCVPRTL